MSSTLCCEFSHYLLTPVDGNIYVFQNQVQVLAVAQTVSSELHLALLGPAAGWGCLLNAPLSLKEPQTPLISSCFNNVGSEDSDCNSEKSSFRDNLQKELWWEERGSCLKTDEMAWVAKGSAISRPTCWINFPLANGRIMQAAQIHTTCLYTPTMARKPLGQPHVQLETETLNKLVKSCCLSLPQRGERKECTPLHSVPQPNKKVFTCINIGLLPELKKKIQGRVFIMFGCKNSDTGKVQVTGKAKRRPRELCNHKGNNCTLNELCDFNQNKKKVEPFYSPYWVQKEKQIKTWSLKS